MDLTHVKSVGIIGAGVAGLSTAKLLIAQGLDCTVLERGSALGGVWADGYSNFGAQVQKELYEFPDWPLPDDASDFTPGPVIQRYLEAYARHFNVWDCIRFNTNVRALRKRDDGRPGWVVTIEETGHQREETYDLVVVCIGLYSNRPHVPKFAGQDAFEGEIIHISDLKSRDRLAGKRVAVVGYGKSATDAALESAAVATETSIIARRPHWPVPPRLAGILPFKWAMLTRVTSTLVPPYYRPSVLERVFHTLGKPLVWCWWRVVELLLTIQCGLWSRFGTRTSLVPDEPVEIGAFDESTMLPRPEFFPKVRNGEIKPHRTEIAEFSPGGMRLRNGEMLDVDVVVLATGWRSDFSFLTNTMDAAIDIDIEDDGLYLYRQMLHPDHDNLAFIGYAATISNILTCNVQARWLGELIAGRFTLPSREEMHRQVEALKAWKRSWMPHSSARAARMMLHLQHYHDELLEDFGANPLRKTGLLAPLMEVLAPYEPRDYAAIVSGEWRDRAAAPEKPSPLGLELSMP